MEGGREGYRVGNGYTRIASNSGPVGMCQQCVPLFFIPGSTPVKLVLFFFTAD